MNTRLNVVIVLARCSKTKKLFGIRFEEKSTNHWMCDWVFPVLDEVGKREGYGRGQIKGDIDYCQYPGCQYCGTTSFARCGTCGNVTCYDYVSKEFTCSWPSCQNYGVIYKVSDDKFITELIGPADA